MLRAIAAAALATTACGLTTPPPATDDATSGDDDGGPDDDGAAPDATPGSCVTTEHGAGCAECVVSPPRATSDSDCVADVCAVDATCCESGWDERCVAVADLVCDVRCFNGVGLSGLTHLGAARHDGGTVWTPWVAVNNDWGWVWTTAWADVDGDGDSDIAAGGECGVQLHLNQGGDDSFVFVTTDEVPLFTCGGDFDSRFHPTRLRWGDVDRDGDLDLAVAGRRGLALVENDGGDLDAPAEPNLATAYIDDIAWHDIERDGWLDLLVMSAGEVRLWRNDRGVLAVDNAWPALENGTRLFTMALCQLDGGGTTRELLVGGDAAITRHDLTDGGPGGGAPVASQGASRVGCGDVDGNYIDEMVLAFDGPLSIHDLDGEIWSQDLALNNAGTPVIADLDDNDEADVAVTSNPSGQADEPFHVLWNDGDIARDPAVSGIDLDDALDTLDAVPVFLGDAAR